jgi:hypothetical protein
MKKYSRCMSNYCGATNPTIFEQDFNSFPPEVQRELTKRGLESSLISRCGFCGDIWVDAPDGDFIKIGVNHLATGRVWKILENPAA